MLLSPFALRMERKEKALVVQTEATSTNANTGGIVEIQLGSQKTMKNVLLFYLIGSVVS